MTASGTSPAPSPSWQSVALAAWACGCYLAAFYILGNLTLLSTTSIVLLATAFTLPFAIGVLGSVMALRLARLERYTGFLTAFLVGLYLILALRLPVFESTAVSEFRARLHGGSWLAAHAIYFLGPAVLIGLLFQKSIGKLAVILTVMTVAATLLGLRGQSGNDAQLADLRFEDAELHRKPNIYLIVTDGFGSLTYMRANGIKTSDFESRLQGRGFRLYDDTFSNYHATLDSMLSTLDMQHHYYRSARNMAEVSQTARQVIGGDNSLVRFLRTKGYRTQYIHQDDYLLLQGCSADYCFPRSVEYAGATSILKQLLPRFLAPARYWDLQPPGVLRNEVSTQIDAGKQSGTPQFQYIHLFAPQHAPNTVVGRCNEQFELGQYAQRIADTVPDIESTIDEIIRKDPDAVILLSGDHGPFIANRCERNFDINTPAEYRDRVGVLTAIRWPSGYDGRFDERIRTNVNLFRFVLASLIGGSSEALGGRVPDDVFVRGSNRGSERTFLKILHDGEYLVPPAELSETHQRKPREVGD